LLEKEENKKGEKNEKADFSGNDLGFDFSPGNCL
jgi:hypothetical protein